MDEIDPRGTQFSRRAKVLRGKQTVWDAVDKNYL